MHLFEPKCFAFLRTIFYIKVGEPEKQMFFFFDFLRCFIVWDSLFFLSESRLKQRSTKMVSEWQREIKEAGADQKPLYSLGCPGGANEASLKLRHRRLRVCAPVSVRVQFEGCEWNLKSKVKISYAARAIFHYAWKIEETRALVRTNRIN